MIDTYDYQDTEGGTPYPDPRRKKAQNPADPLLDELTKTNEGSPSGQIQPNVDPAALPPPVTTSTNSGLPPSPYTPPPAAAAKGAPSSYVVEGLDMGKLTSGAGTTPKYQFWRNMQSGMSYEDAVKSIGGTVINGTQFRLQDGTMVDTRRDEEGANAAQWLELGNGSGGGAGGGAAGAGGTGGAGGSAGGNQNDAIHQMLMHELMGLQGPVDPNDPRLKGQVDAFRNEQSRATGDARSALAERANYQGLPSGYVDAGIQSGIEDAGLKTASFQGQLTQKEYENKRNELDRLMQMALSSSDSAAARSLQAEISALDRAQQNTQFYDTQAYNVNRDQNNLDYLMAQMLMNGGS